MITAVNALLECFVTGLFTAAILVLCSMFNLFPIILVEPMTQEQLDELQSEDEVDDEE